MCSLLELLTTRLCARYTIAKIAQNRFVRKSKLCFWGKVTFSLDLQLCNFFCHSWACSAVHLTNFVCARHKFTLAMHSDQLGCVEQRQPFKMLSNTKSTFLEHKRPKTDYVFFLVKNSAFGQIFSYCTHSKFQIITILSLFE